MAQHFTIRQLISRVYDGSLRIPAFQRGFVWTSESVAFLMDSLYRSYPVGHLLLWRTREPLQKERKLGPFELPEPQKNWPIDYVLDGQQRITSVFGVFQTQLPPTERGDWFDVYFDLHAPEGALEDQFVPLRPEDADNHRYFPLRTLLESRDFFRACQTLRQDIQDRVVELQRRFQEALIPFELIEFEDREQVAIIFERVNRAGVQLDAFQLLSAWTWSTEFDLNEALSDLAAEVNPFGFGEIYQDPNLFMKCCSAVVKGHASVKAVVSLHGPSVRSNFDKVKTGIHGAIDFLRREIRAHSLAIVPYPAMIVPLARFFGSDTSSGYHPSAEQSVELRRWFWRSCFSRRYSSGVGRAHAADIQAMDRLRADHNAKISEFPCTVSSDFFLENSFSLSSVNSRTFVLLLAQLEPRSFLSDTVVNLETVLQRCNRNEFHHVFPRAYLAREGSERDQQNVLANICFLSSADNQRIKDKSPSHYKKYIQQDRLQSTLASHAISPDALDVNYTEFLKTEQVVWICTRKSLLRRLA